MIKFEKAEVIGWEAATRGMRNPKNSWDRCDSCYCTRDNCVKGKCPRLGKACADIDKGDFVMGPNDLDRMKKLVKAGTDHRKYLRMIIVYVDITAPLYWWKEFDTYKVGTVANSCSTMHKIADKYFTKEDFSWEHLSNDILVETTDGTKWTSIFASDMLITILNLLRDKYLETKDKDDWWQMIQLLPSSYNQKRTIMMSYEVLANIYKSRKNHKLDEWKEHEPDIPAIDATTSEQLNKGEVWPHMTDSWIANPGFCDWIKTLPYSELITGDFKED